MCKGLYKNSCINRANIIPISDAHRLANTQSKCNTYYYRTLNWQWNCPGSFTTAKWTLKKKVTYKPHNKI